MKVYVFGNQDHKEDSAAFKVAETILVEPWAEAFNLDFIYVKPNQDLPFIDEEKVVILDVAAGLSEVKLITDDNLNKIRTLSSSTVHDFDLGFQVKYLKKLGKLGEVYIIGIPMEGNINYDSIHSIVKKLVAQDMQGS